MKIINEIRNTVQGAEVLKDWWGAGGHPVAQSKAEQRGLSCVRGDDGKPCPNNRGASWLEEHSKEPIAIAIKENLEIKHKLKMETPLDGSLHMCSICGCFLPLKVHVPIEHIKSHTTPEKLSRLPKFCWQRIEIENS